MSNNKVKIIGNLIKDTMNSNIKWDVSFQRDYIKASYNMPTTTNKTIIFKLIYFTYNIKMSKINVLYELKIDDRKMVKTIMDMGGKNRKAEVKEIIYLMKEILKKNN